MKLNEITHDIIGAAFKVHSTCGPGLLENAYQVCLRYELSKRGLVVQEELVLPVKYDGIQIDLGYRVDFLVEHSVIVELKSVKQILPIHEAQLLSYLKLGNKRIGLLINFNVLDLKQGITRLAN